MTLDAPETPAERGRRLGTTFDAGLRAIEHREREERLDELAHEPPRPSAASSARERADFERLLAFYSAVQRSRVWRLAQYLRRPLGRAW
jgi:hypothetical protein